LCNFFRTHIKDFAVIAAPLFKLTRKDSGYKGSPLPETAMDAYVNLRKQLISEPVMVFPRTDCQYTLITDAATGTAETTGGLRAKLTQVDKDGKFFTISFASRQLKDHVKNYSPFPLQEVHPLHRSQTTGEARPSPQENHEPIPDSTSGA
jgi:hypothetical protein